MDVAENREHVRWLFQQWKEGRLAPKDLHGLRDISFLRDRSGAYVKPAEAYLPPEMGGLREVLRYLDLAGGRPVVDGGYREKKEEGKDWADFLAQLGIARLPRRLYDREVSEYSRRPTEEFLAEVKEWGLSDDSIKTIKREDSTSGFQLSRSDIDGLQSIEQALRQATLRADDARPLWVTLAELAKADPPDSWCKARLEWFYVVKRSTDPEPCEGRLRTLKNAPWLPDEEGVLRGPCELAVPGLREVLGAAGRYPHHSIKVEQEGEKQLARALGMRTDAGLETVLEHLAREAQETEDPKCIRPVYGWLARRKEAQDHDHIRSAFRERPLILVPGWGWFKASEVIWRDCSGTLPSLEGPWKERDLQALFREVIGVREEPESSHYASFVLGARERGQPDLQQLQRIAERVAERWDDLPEHVRERLRIEPCWPGRSGGDLGWYRAAELCVKNDEELAKVFRARLLWWELGEALAKLLEVECLSAATSRVDVNGRMSEDPGLGRPLRAIWPYLRRVIGDTLADTPPALLIVDGQVRLVFALPELGAESRPIPVEAAYDQATHRALVDDAAIADPADPVGDALGRALRKPNLREFVKDLWNAADDAIRRASILKRWEQRFGVSFAGIAAPPPEQEELVASYLDAITADIDQSRSAEAPPLGGPVGIRKAVRSVQRPPERPRPDRPLSNARAEVERLAMQRAIARLTALGYAVEDVSGYGLGYDLEANRKTDHAEFFVEVKGQRALSDVIMTTNEWKQACRYQERYWLLVVAPARGGYIWRVIDPACLPAEERPVDQKQIVVRRKDWNALAGPLG